VGITLLVKKVLKDWSAKAPVVTIDATVAAVTGTPAMDEPVGKVEGRPAGRDTLVPEGKEIGRPPGIATLVGAGAAGKAKGKSSAGMFGINNLS